jgi:hypothetical protein
MIKLKFRVTKILFHYNLFSKNKIKYLLTIFADVHKLEQKTLLV